MKYPQTYCLPEIDNGSEPGHPGNLAASQLNNYVTSPKDREQMLTTERLVATMLQTVIVSNNSYAMILGILTGLL
jgi:hypothetical protein